MGPRQWIIKQESKGMWINAWDTESEVHELSARRTAAAHQRQPDSQYTYSLSCWPMQRKSISYHPSTHSHRFGAGATHYACSNLWNRRRRRTATAAAVAASRLSAASSRLTCSHITAVASNVAWACLALRSVAPARLHHYMAEIGGAAWADSLRRAPLASCRRYWQPIKQTSHMQHTSTIAVSTVILIINTRGNTHIIMINDVDTCRCEQRRRDEKRRCNRAALSLLSRYRYSPSSITIHYSVAAAHPHLV